MLFAVIPTRAVKDKTSRREHDFGLEGPNIFDELNGLLDIYSVACLAIQKALIHVADDCANDDGDLALLFEE